MTVCPFPLLAKFHYQQQQALYKGSRDLPLVQGFLKAADRESPVDEQRDLGEFI